MNNQDSSFLRNTLKEKINITCDFAVGLLINKIEPRQKFFSENKKYIIIMVSEANEAILNYWKECEKFLNKFITTVDGINVTAEYCKRLGFDSIFHREGKIYIKIKFLNHKQKILFIWQENLLDLLSTV